MGGTIRVLHVDDERGILELTASYLERVRETLTVVSTTSVEEGLERIDEGSIDCVVSDYDMPGADGLSFLEAVRDRDETLPFLLFTGKGSEEIASEAISAGVTDYIRKGSGRDQYEVLANRIENAVAKRRSEIARMESERKLVRYRTLVEAVADPMYVLDENGTVTMVNDAMAAYTGYDRERLVGDHVTSLVTDAAFEDATALLEEVAAGDRDRGRIEFAFETADGTERIGEAHISSLTDAGDVVGSVGVVRDISDRNERERELAQYETIIETALVGILVLDEMAIIRWMNDAFPQPFEESEAELLGTPFPEVIERGYFDREVVRTYVENVRELLSESTDRERVIHDVRMTTADGEELIYDVHTALLPLEDGEFQGTVNVFRDITKRRNYQRELERQNERLEQFANLVSHDLRNPLNVAQGNLELIAEEYESDSVCRVRRSLERMEELVDELLTLAKRGRTIGEREPVSIADVAEGAWAAVDTADTTLELPVDRTVRADEGRVRELLENLFSNAIEHAGADVTVTVGALDDGWFVEDDGSGFADGRADVFELGYTTAETGTGFGLGIVEQIADAHGWTVTARDRESGGARFEIRGAPAVQTDDA